MPINVPGVYDIHESVYHADPCADPSLSRSIGHLFLTATPKHVWSAHPRLGGSKVDHAPTDVMDVGSAIHRLVLGAGADICVIDAADRRRKETREEIAAARARGETPILVTDFEAAVGAAVAVRREIDRIPDLRGIGEAGAGTPESTFIWQENGGWFRSRPDWVPDRPATIVDLKTTRRLSSPYQFARSIVDKGYDLQAAMIRAGHRAIHGADCDVVFVVVEQEAPHAVSLVGISPSMWDFAEERWGFVRDQWTWYMRHVKPGEWPSWPAHVCLAQVTPWQEHEWAAVKVTADAVMAPYADASPQMKIVA